jgi:hypothetical protein
VGSTVEDALLGLRTAGATGVEALTVAVTHAAAHTRPRPRPLGWSVDHKGRGMGRRLIVLMACVVAIGCTPKSTPTVRPVTPPPASETTNDLEGYGPCVEEARDGAGNISDAEVERCVDEHL